MMAFFLRSVGISTCVLFFTSCKPKETAVDAGAETQVWIHTCKIVRSLASSIPVYSGASGASKLLGHLGQGSVAKPIKLYVSSSVEPDKNRIFVKIGGVKKLEGRAVWVDSATVTCLGEPPQPQKQICATLSEGIVCDTKENFKSKLQKEIVSLNSDLKNTPSDLQKWTLGISAARNLCYMGDISSIISTLRPAAADVAKGGDLAASICHLRRCIDGTSEAVKMDVFYGKIKLRSFCPANMEK